MLPTFDQRVILLEESTSEEYKVAFDENNSDGIYKEFSDVFGFFLI